MARKKSWVDLATNRLYIPRPGLLGKYVLKISGKNNTKRFFSTVPGKAAVPPPTSRSGHRMVLLKRHLVLFGGFHDNLDKCTYFNDVHVFSLEERYINDTLRLFSLTHSRHFGFFKSTQKTTTECF